MSATFLGVCTVGGTMARISQSFTDNSGLWPGHSTLWGAPALVPVTLFLIPGFVLPVQVITELWQLQKDYFPWKPRGLFLSLPSYFTFPP